MTAIAIEILSQPSKSKGWGRYALSADGAAVVKSSTGNRWVSAPHKGDAEDGATVELTIEVMNRQGKMGREERSSERFSLVVDPTASVDVESRTMSQGMRLRVTGARLAEVPR